jgi:DNA-binding LacI/PurR family transcriptional regulator
MLNLQDARLIGPKDRLPVAAEVERELRQRIVGGIYRPHAYLPSERQLAKDLQTSRVTVSQALGALERDGLVLRSPGRGTRVLPAVERLTRPKIGILHGELPAINAIRPDSLQTLQGIRDALERMGYAYDLVSIPASKNLLAAECLAKYGAIILIESAYGDAGQLAELARKRIVVVAKLEVDVDVSATFVDHEEPMHKAVQTFVGLGHRRIAFVGREATYGFHGRAREGYLAGMREAGLPVDESLMAVCDKTDALSSYFAARSLLRLRAEPPTAIIAARDAIAEGVCRAVEEAGLTVGQHVSVIGFDDLTWPEGRQFLTTFREPCYEMGAAAAEMLVERIVNGPMAPERRQFEVSFVLRRTAGPHICPGQSIVSSGAS